MTVTRLTLLFVLATMQAILEVTGCRVESILATAHVLITAALISSGAGFQQQRSICGNVWGSMGIGNLEPLPSGLFWWLANHLEQH